VRPASRSGVRSCKSPALCAPAWCRHSRQAVVAPVTAPPRHGAASLSHHPPLQPLHCESCPRRGVYFAVHHPQHGQAQQLGNARPAPRDKQSTLLPTDAPRSLDHLPRGRERLLTRSRVVRFQTRSSRSGRYISRHCRSDTRSSSARVAVELYREASQSLLVMIVLAHTRQRRRAVGADARNASAVARPKALKATTRGGNWPHRRLRGTGVYATQERVIPCTTD
jgi:hypothetical protein